MSVSAVLALAGCGAEGAAGAAGEGDNLAQADVNGAVDATAATAEIVALQERATNLEAAVSELLATVAEQNSTIQAQSTTIALLQADLALQEQAADALEEDLEDAEDEIEALQDDLGLAWGEIYSQAVDITGLQTVDSSFYADLGLLQAADFGHDAGLADLGGRVGALEPAAAQLQEDVSGLAAAMPAEADRALLAALGGVLSVEANDLSGYDVVFSGANVHVRSGSGATDGGVNGLGNLIIGYNEANDGSVYTAQLSEERGGSHNLIIGEAHAWSSFGGLALGEANWLDAEHAVAFGRENVASGEHSAVRGRYNDASGEHSSAAGYFNAASGGYSTVIGGYLNGASGPSSVILAGYYNAATGYDATITGGAYHLASGAYSSISGGYGNTASGSSSAVSGGTNNTASGDGSSVLGGYLRSSAALNGTSYVP